MSVIGQRISETAPRYIKHPPASNTDYWGNGATYSASDAMIVDSNVSHLESESLRHLFSDIGPGEVTNFLARSNTWDNLMNTQGPPAATTPDSAHEISWSRKCARRYGAFNLIADCDLAGPGDLYTLRTIRVYVKLSSDSVLYCTAAVTSSIASPADEPPMMLSVDATGKTGDTHVVFTLTPTAPIRAEESRARWQCRGPGGPSQRGTVQSVVIQAYLWLGWFAYDDGFSPVNHLSGISAWEKRV